MAYYRLYFVHDDHFTHFAGFDAAHDDAAVAAAERLQDGEMELWCGARMVKRFKVGVPSE